MELEEKIKNILNKIKPFLNNDGGDVEFIKYENNKVYIKLLGACVDCPMSDDTVKDMIEYTLKFEIPEIEEVINIIQITIQFYIMTSFL